MITRNPQLTNAKNLKLINTKTCLRSCAARCYFLVREDLAHGQYTQLPVGRAHNPAITTPPPPPGRYSLFISRVGMCRPKG